MSFLSSQLNVKIDDATRDKKELEKLCTSPLAAKVRIGDRCIRDQKTEIDSLGRLVQSEKSTILRAAFNSEKSLDYMTKHMTSLQSANDKLQSKITQLQGEAVALSDEVNAAKAEVLQRDDTIEGRNSAIALSESSYKSLWQEYSALSDDLAVSKAEVVQKDAVIVQKEEELRLKGIESTGNEGKSFADRLLFDMY